MLLPSDQPEAAAAVDACERCPRDATPGLVWGHKLCDACFGLWHDEAPGAAEALEMLLPAEKPAGLTAPAYLRWTAAWILRGQARAA